MEVARQRPAYMRDWNAPDKGALRHPTFRPRKFQPPAVGWWPPIASSSRLKTALPTYGIYGKPVFPTKPERSLEFLREFRRVPVVKWSHRAPREAPGHSQIWKSEVTSGCSR